MNENGSVAAYDHNSKIENEQSSYKGKHDNENINDYKNSLYVEEGSNMNGYVNGYIEANEKSNHISSKSSVKTVYPLNKKKNKYKKKYKNIYEKEININGGNCKINQYVNLGDNDKDNENDNYNDIGNIGANYYEINTSVSYDEENKVVEALEGGKYVHQVAEVAEIGVEQAEVGHSEIEHAEVGHSEIEHAEVGHSEIEHAEVEAEIEEMEVEEERKRIRKKNWKGRTFSRFTPGGVRSSTVLFLCTAIGVGFLSFPYVFSKLGIILSVILIFLNAIESYVTTNILCLSSLEHNTFVYGNLLKKIGHKYHKTIIDIGLTFGFLSSYILILILISNFLSSIFYVFNFPAFFCNHIFLIIVICLLILPVTFRDQVGSLNSFLVFSLFSLSITVLTIGWQTRYYYNLLNDKKIVLFNIDIHFFKCFNILLFSFSQQPNACFITGQFNQPTHKRLTKSAYRSVLLQIIFYTLFGFLGYLSFLNTAKDNVVLNYEDSNVSILLCKFLLSVTFFFSVPLNFMGSYSSILSLYQSGRNRFLRLYLYIFRRNRYSENLSALLREDTQNPFQENIPDDVTENTSTHESQTDDKDQRMLVSICVTILCALIAFNVKKLSNVIGIGGGITSTLISW
ncbi:amino acid transporter AAT1 [Plasmodium brasilianum]|uniref:Amino acid transporter AAT1 n=1 Tax=Plasmodium brasilianum TaxID=5824 RepID=A0ACB9Y7L7_PLABR|nr:amino acid transporter AAT1 [Plasmodium brasilianum]